MKNTKDGLNKQAMFLDRKTHLHKILLINLFINFPINKFNHTITQIISRFYFQNTVKLTLKLKQKNTHTRMIKKAQKKRNERYGKVCVCACARMWVSACGCTQSCPTLCDPTDGSLPGSSVHGILQARILEQVAMPSTGDFPEPGIEPESLMSPALAGSSYHQHQLESPGNTVHISPITEMRQVKFMQIIQ